PGPRSATSCKGGGSSDTGGGATGADGLNRGCCAEGGTTDAITDPGAGPRATGADPRKSMGAAPCSGLDAQAPSAAKADTNKLARRAMPIAILPKSGDTLPHGVYWKLNCAALQSSRATPGWRGENLAFPTR